MSVQVDARFAGGPIIVTPSPSEDGEPRLVQVDVPGLSFDLFPHEARAVAAALVTAADTADRPILRRRPGVDEELRRMEP